MSAPERIFARLDTATVYMDGSSPLVARTREFRGSVEYVRADTAEGNSFDALLIAGADLLSALERYGFPVSAAATTGLMERGSIEAQRLHRAAIGFRCTELALFLAAEFVVALILIAIGAK